MEEASMPPRSKKRMMKQLQCSERTTQLMELPLDILLDILSRLPTRSLFSLLCVSKTLRSLVDCPSFAHEHSQYIATTNYEDLDPSHVMVLTNSQLITLRALNPLSPFSEFSFDISNSLRNGFNLKLVLHGLLLFNKKESTTNDQALLLLVNPLMGEVLNLPPPPTTIFYDVLPPRWNYELYGMGYDAMTSTHKIVRLSRPGPKHDLVAQMYELGTGSSSSWRQISSVPPPSCRLSSKNCVSAYGNMHWLVNGFSSDLEFRILSFDFKREEFEWTPHTNLPDFGKRSVLHLINFRGRLAIVDVTAISSPKNSHHHDQIEIWVMKSYKNFTWEKKYAVQIDLDPYCMKSWETPFRFHGVGPGSVGAWEHGIFLRDITSTKSKNMVVFLDVDSGVIRAVQVGSSSMSDCDDLMPVNVFSYTGGYISLRKYGDLMEAETGERNFFSVGKMMQRSMLTRYCFEVGV
ncbi:unnamed protein product [Prunus armeniaca]|uniref:F-box domain-containing protein n=1 Tax=Prunus armeniaca TaxID=36596 RepID=A0A6J5UDS0_PRUAR|nr:unnamed protein product [Prunus armeniaca]